MLKIIKITINCKHLVISHDTKKYYTSAFVRNSHDLAYVYRILDLQYMFMYSTTNQVGRTHSYTIIVYERERV